MRYRLTFDAATSRGCISPGTDVLVAQLKLLVGLRSICALKCTFRRHSRFFNNRKPITLSALSDRPVRRTPLGAHHAHISPTNSHLFSLPGIGVGIACSWNNDHHAISRYVTIGACIQSLFVYLFLFQFFLIEMMIIICITLFADANASTNTAQSVANYASNVEEAAVFGATVV